MSSRPTPLVLRTQEEKNFDVSEEDPRSRSPSNASETNIQTSIIQTQKASIFQRATNKRDLLLLSKKAAEEKEKTDLPQIKIYLNQVMEPDPHSLMQPQLSPRNYFDPQDLYSNRRRLIRGRPSAHQRVQRLTFDENTDITEIKERQKFKELS